MAFLDFLKSAWKHLLIILFGVGAITSVVMLQSITPSTNWIDDNNYFTNFSDNTDKSVTGEFYLSSTNATMWPNFADNFEQATSVPDVLRWTNNSRTSGTINITGGYLVSTIPVASSTYIQLRTANNMISQNMTITLQMERPAPFSPNGEYGFWIGDLNLSATATGYLVMMRTNGGQQVRVARYNAGVITNIYTGLSPSNTFHTYNITKVGNNFTFYHDGTLLVSDANLSMTQLYWVSSRLWNDTYNLLTGTMNTRWDNLTINHEVPADLPALSYGNLTSLGFQVSGARGLKNATISINGIFPSLVNYTIYLSPNDGTNWYNVTNNTEFNFPINGSKIRYRIFANATDWFTKLVITNITMHVNYFPQDITIVGFDGVCGNTYEYQTTSNITAELFDNNSQIINQTFCMDFNDPKFGTNYTCGNGTINIMFKAPYVTNIYFNDNTTEKSFFYNGFPAHTDTSDADFNSGTFTNIRVFSDSISIAEIPGNTCVRNTTERVGSLGPVIRGSMFNNTFMTPPYFSCGNNTGSRGVRDPNNLSVSDENQILPFTGQNYTYVTACEFATAQSFPPYEPYPDTLVYDLQHVYQINRLYSIMLYETQPDAGTALHYYYPIRFSVSQDDINYTNVTFTSNDVNPMVAPSNSWRNTSCNGDCNVTFNQTYTFRYLKAEILGCSDYLNGTPSGTSCRGYNSGFRELQAWRAGCVYNTTSNATFNSSIVDTTIPDNVYLNFTYHQSVPNLTNVSYQFRANNSNIALLTQAWSPNVSVIGGRYFQYQAILNSTSNTTTPYVLDTTISWSIIGQIFFIKALPNTTDYFYTASSVFFNNGGRDAQIDVLGKNILDFTKSDFLWPGYLFNTSVLINQTTQGTPLTLQFNGSTTQVFYITIPSVVNYTTIKWQVSATKAINVTQTIFIDGKNNETYNNTGFNYTSQNYYVNIPQTGIQIQSAFINLTCLNDSLGLPPSNVTLYMGNSTVLFNFTTCSNSTRTANFGTNITQYLSTCNSTTEFCKIPFFTRGTNGGFTLEQLNITYNVTMSNIVFDAGLDGIADWVYQPPLNSTQNVTINPIIFNQYANGTQCRSQTCNIPIGIIVWNRYGNMTLSNFNISYKIPSPVVYNNAEITNWSQTHPGQDIPINVRVAGGGNVSMNNINFSSKNSQFDVNAHYDGDITHNATNTTCTFRVRHSPFNVTFSPGISGWLMLPQTLNSKNVTPIGQSTVKSIYRVTSTSIHNHTTDVGIRIYNFSLNPCINLTYSNTNNKSQGYIISNSTTPIAATLFIFNLSQKNTTGAWSFGDFYNCIVTTKSVSPPFAWNSWCSDCVRVN